MKIDIEQLKSQHRRSATRRGSQRQGADFERWLMASAPATGKLVKHEPRIVPTGRDGQGRPVYRLAGRGWVDMTLYLGGHTFDFEAKSTADPERWSLDERIDHTHPEGHQGRTLCWLAGNGHRAGVVLQRQLALGASIYVLPWSPEGAPFLGKSARWEALEPWRTPRGRAWWEAVEACDGWDAWYRYREEGW